MQNANKEARAFTESLALSPAVLHIVQTIASLSWQPPSDRRSEKYIGSILRDAALHLNPADDEDVECDNTMDRTTPAMIDTRGTFFFSDVVWEDKDKQVYRLPCAREFNLIAIARLHNQENIDVLKGLFGVRTATNPISILQPRARWTAVRELTFAIEDLVGEITTVVYGIQFGLPAPREMEGRDRNVDRDEQIHIGDQLFKEPTTMDRIVTVIFRQFYYDILRATPSGKSVHDPYVTLTLEELGTVTSETFQQHILPFKTIRLAPVVDTVWSNDIYDSLFPYKDKRNPNPNVKRGHYHHCQYYHLWIRLINRLSADQVSRLRTIMLKEFMTLQWLPFASDKKIWNTREVPSGKISGIIKRLPVNADGPSPVVAVRKWYSGSTNLKLSRYMLR